MFTKLLKRSLATGTVLGAVVATAALAAPATVSAAPAASPKIELAACGYQGAVATTTSVRLTPGNIVRAGQKVVAHVTVSSGAGTPTGTLMLKVSASKARFFRIHGGHLNKSLPGLKAGHTYTVIARYQKQNCFQASTGVTYLTVLK